MSPGSPRITVMGAGGVGGCFGARLAQAGCDVGFVARGAHLAALRSGGLRVESPLGDIHLPEVRAGETPESLGVADYVFICVKLWETEAAVQAVSSVVRDGTVVISFQNGIQKDEVLRRTLGKRAVMGGVAYISASIARPGVVRQSGALQRLVLGECDGGHSPRAAALRGACVRGGIEASVSSDIRRDIWEKFVFLVGLSAATASMRKPIGPIRSHPGSRAFLLDLMREVAAVGRAQGIELAEDFAEQRLAFCDTLPPDMTSSMHSDLERGSRLELDWLSGDVVAMGKVFGVPAPLNRAVADILSLYSQGRANP